jgi:hypothetical protein
VGENILFLPEPGGQITAHVQISYAGDTNAFSWVVPVEGVPTVALSTEVLFQRLASATAPSAVLTVGNAECSNPYVGSGWDDADGGDDDSATGDDDDSTVDVLSETDVGAYHATVVASTDAQALLDWLNCHGYRIAYSALPRVQAYLNAGRNFLALRLLAGANAGDLVPIAMTFPGEHPMIPLVITAVATQPNLRVRAWFLGEGRAVSYNYDNVWLNDARLPWNTPWSWGYGGGYDALVAKAVDEAGGHAFVTEFAGDASVLAGTIYPVGGYPVEELRQETTPWGFYWAALDMGLPRTGMMQSLLRRHIPMPQALVDQGVSEQQFYANLQFWLMEFPGHPFDPDAFVDDIVALILTPMQDADLLFSDPERPILTRMTTVLSGWEMNIDPDFLWLPPPVDPVPAEPADWPHQGLVPATRARTVDFIGGTSATSCWDVAQVVNTTAGPRPVLVWPWSKVPEFPPQNDDDVSCLDLPASMVIERWDEKGDVVLLADRRAEIAAMAPSGRCVMGYETPAPVDPPADVTWPEDSELMPQEAVDPALCDQIDSSGDTGFGEDWNGGEGGDDDATAGDDDDASGDDDVLAPVASCQGCGTTPAAFLPVLFLPAWTRRRPRPASTLPGTGRHPPRAPAGDPPSFAHAAASQ